MAVRVFQDILERRARMGPTSEAYARRWFRSQALSTKVNPATVLAEGRTRFRRVPQVGHMYLYEYDPKHKLTLPYYDRYPLIFPLKTTSVSAGNASIGQGFFGLNMHYLPPVWRARLMDALWEMTSDKRMDQNTRLRISYQILSKAAGFRFFRPCFKMYLFGHMRSPFMHVEPREWDVALMLPLARFQKQSPSRVFHDSWRSVRQKKKREG